MEDSENHSAVHDYGTLAEVWVGAACYTMFTGTNLHQKLQKGCCSERSSTHKRLIIIGVRLKADSDAVVHHQSELVEKEARCH
jgi:hypothetical protein